jgi:hypothetical protein
MLDARFFNRFSGQVYLWSAVIIFATASFATRKLIDVGAQQLIDGRNPILFCNVLFLGNLCSISSHVGVSPAKVIHFSQGVFPFNDSCTLK